jgi:hypothetical protein
MKCTLSLAAFCLTICLTACNREIPIPPPSAPGSMHINLTTSNAGEEIIFSETNGKILLDTMSPFPNPLVATLNTKQSLIDISYIDYYSFVPAYFISTYKGVDPAKWSTLTIGSALVPYPSLNSTQGTVVYKNTPSVSLTDLMAVDYTGGYTDQTTGPVNGYLNVTYSQYAPHNYLYLLLPQAGLYNFHAPAGPADTVDLSHMDTVVSLNFNKPSAYTITDASLNGILDTADYSKSVFLYNTIAGLPDVEYPRKLVQKMELLVSASKPDSGYASYYSYSDSVPGTLPFQDENAYKISSASSSNFTVGFTTAHPTIYSAYYSNNSNLDNSTLRYAINASPDSTHLDPQAMLNTLKNAKLLQGQALSNLQLNNFYMETDAGFDYNGFINYSHNPAQLQTQRVPWWLTFSKNF